jgi:single-strand DNA-binding protein
MRSLNKVMLIGNLGADPEIRSLTSGQPVATLRIATNETWQDKQGGRQEKTEWHRVVAFGRLAEIVRDYVKKGQKIYIEGRIQTRNWQDQQGQTKYMTEIVAQSLLMLSGRGEGGDPGAGGGGGGAYAGARSGGGSMAGSTAGSAGAGPGGDDQPAPDYDDMGPVGGADDSDLPF